MDDTVSKLKKEKRLVYDFLVKNSVKVELHTEDCPSCHKLETDMNYYTSETVLSNHNHKDNPHEDVIEDQAPDNIEEEHPQITQPLFL